MTGPVMRVTGGSPVIRKTGENANEHEMEPRSTPRILRPYSAQGRVIVLSYSLAIDYRLEFADTYAISMMSSWVAPQLPALPKFKDILSLRFDDAQEEDSDADTLLFAQDHAEAIWQFVKDLQGQDHHLVVHCEAGISRSPAVAAALADGFGGDDVPWYFENYVPNRYVFDTMLRFKPGGMRS
jgi:predicted protein tyrosine phosphatase